LTQQQLQSAQQQQVSDGFTRAIGNLNSKDVSIRLGGIFGLERISMDSEDYRVPVVGVLRAYVCTHAFPAKPSTPAE
jgi:hypothetical protein